jgi:CTP:phosphocholine cytidylyltransferase-like protein
MNVELFILSGLIEEKECYELSSFGDVYLTEHEAIAEAYEILNRYNLKKEDTKHNEWGFFVDTENQRIEINISSKTLNYPTL